MRKASRRPRRLVTSFGVVLSLVAGLLIVGAVPAFAVSPPDQTITFNPIVDHSYGDAPFTITASATSGLAVHFAVTGSADCSLVDQSPAPSKARVSILHAGTCEITASQAGDGVTWDPAPDVIQTFTIDQQPQTITGFAAIASRDWSAPDFAVSATSNRGLDVAFGAVGDCTATDAGVSSATIHIAVSVAGSCTITATQPGTTDIAAADPVPQVLTITKKSQAITFAQPANRLVGDGDFVVTATANSGLVPSMAASGDCTVAASPPFTVHLTAVAPGGSCVLTASQAGNAAYNAASNVARTILIREHNQFIDFTAPATPRSVGTTVPLSATSLDSDTNAATGLTVAFAASPASVCHMSGASVVLDHPGDCAITASQAGVAPPTSPSYNPAPVVVKHILVTSANTTTALTIAPKTASVLGNTDVSLTATVTSPSGLIPSGLTVEFKIGTIVVGSAVTNASGVAVFHFFAGTWTGATGQKFAVYATTQAGGDFNGSFRKIAKTKGLKINP